MANPPITIGPFNNVPAPGSPIASAWAQQITTYVVTRPVFQFTNPPVGAASLVNFTIPLANVANVVQSPAGLLTGGGVQIPAAWAGLWQVNCMFDVGSHVNGKSVGLWMQVGTTRYGQVQVAANATEALRSASSAVIRIPAGGGLLIFAAYNSNSSAVAVGMLDVTGTWLGPSPV